MDADINILIMDDREEKVKALTRLLIEECGLNVSSISVARTINEGRRFLRDQYFDLLILDLVMPNFDGEDANNDDAPKFIDELYENRGLCLPNQIIGFTAHEDEYINLKNRFEDKLWSLIRYQNGNNDWKPKIRSKVLHLIHSKDRLIKSITECNKYDIGIICALDEEYEQMKSAFGDNCEAHSIPDFPLPYFSKRIMTAQGNEFAVCSVCIGHAGLIMTSVISSIMIKTFHLNFIFMTGIAAGFSGRELRLGDVVISKSISEPIIGKVIQEGDNMNLKREIHSLNSDARLISNAQQLSSNADFINEFNQHLRKNNIWTERDNINIITAPTVSVPFVVGSQQLMEQIKDTGDRKLAALDMEGYGLYQAGTILKTPSLWIKAVSDMGDEHKGDEFHKKCAYASAYFLYKLIKETL